MPPVIEQGILVVVVVITVTVVVVVVVVVVAALKELHIQAQSLRVEISQSPPRLSLRSTI